MKFESILLQGSHNPSESKRCITVPIYQTSAFNFFNVQHAADLFDLKEFGDLYTRLGNPTTQVLEERLAAIEGGVGALCVSSGQSASFLAVMNIAKSGDEVVASANLYGGTINLLGCTMKKMGIKTHFVASENPEDYEKYINEKTRCIFAETVGNPAINVSDIEGLAKVAHRHNIPLIVDNTIPTAYLCRPVDFGADIVVYSTTKYISGHGNAMGGVIIDSGNFDWEKSGKFPEITEPDESYHGLSYTKSFGKMAYIVKARAQLIRDIGSCPSPFNSYLTILGLETLHLRMKRHSESALKVAEFLEKQDRVKAVYYPKLKSNKYYNLAEKYLPKGASSLVSFELDGDRAFCTKFIEKLKLLIHATNLGDVRSIITYPALTTHRQLSDEQLSAAGISSTFMRLSVGLEDIEDIMDDISQALAD